MFSEKGAFPQSVYDRANVDGNSKMKVMLRKRKKLQMFVVVTLSTCVYDYSFFNISTSMFSLIISHDAGD